MQFIDVWITCPSNDVATRIAEELVGGRLAACANVLGGVQSIYRWQGKVEREAEVALLVKTRAAYFDELAARVVTLHPYDTPAVIALPVAAVNDAYAEWLVDATAREG